MLNRDSVERWGEQFAVLFQLPPLCADVRSGVMLEDELVHRPVWLNPSNSLCSLI